MQDINFVLNYFIMEETQKTKKPLSVTTIVVILLVVGVAWPTMSKMFFRAKVKTLTGGVVNVKNSDQYQVKTKDGEVMVSEEKGLAWPSDLPINIPKYDNGKIKAYSHLSGQTAWTIIISDTNEEYFKKYKEALIADKWIAGDEMVSVVSMVSMKKDGYDVNVVWDASSTGALITLSQTLK